MTASAQADPDRAWLATMRVLYVEDDDDTRALLGRFLRRRVGCVVEAVDGDDALAQFERARPSLVITDIQMPGRVDGLDVAAEVRRRDAAVPILVTTAHEHVDYLRRALDARVDRYVSKPVDVDALDAALLACARALRVSARREAESKLELERLRAGRREALGLLAGGMSHDYNNILQAVQLNLEVASGLTVDGSELRELVAAALDATGEARELSARLLAFHQGWPLSPREASVLPALRAALADGLWGGDASLRLELAPSLPAVVHDASLLERAFGQIVRNARDAMGDAGTLWVSCAARAVAPAEVEGLAPGDYVTVTFRDEGPGVAEGDLDRLFDPYFSTKPRGMVRGMGLGLALCQSIVLRHGGALRVSSAAGEGATFTVLLPAAG